MNKKSLLIAFLIVILTGGLLLVAIDFDTAKASTEVTGIISSDTTWTKANSPYTLTGNVLVDDGAILTIEPGVTVSLNGYFINVSGTLNAKGNEADKITLNGSGTSYSGEWEGRIVFSNTSTNSIIEYAEVTSSPDTIIGIYSASVTTINNCIIGGTTGNAVDINRSSPNLSGNIISNNGANGITINGNSSPTITANSISNNGNSGIQVNRGSPTISDNNITNNRGGISSSLLTTTDLAKISRNFIANNYYGVYLFFTQTTPNNNLVTGNLITNNSEGITIQIGYNFRGTCNVLSNTITANRNGIVVTGGIANDITINQNNIFNNKQYNAKNEGGGSIEATNNWWGTTDAQAINQTIAGALNFVPFLNSPNSQALSVPEFPSWIILPLFTIGTLMALVCFRKRKH